MQYEVLLASLFAEENEESEEKEERERELKKWLMCNVFGRRKGKG